MKFKLTGCLFSSVNPSNAAAKSTNKEGVGGIDIDVDVDDHVNRTHRKIQSKNHFNETTMSVVIFFLFCIPIRNRSIVMALWFGLIRLD